MRFACTLATIFPLFFVALASNAVVASWVAGIAQAAYSPPWKTMLAHRGFQVRHFSLVPPELRAPLIMGILLLFALNMLLPRTHSLQYRGMVVLGNGVTVYMFEDGNQQAALLRVHH